MRATIVILAAIAISACARTPHRPAAYDVAVDSYALPDQPGSTYFILPASPATNPQDLQFMELASQVVRGLSMIGMKLVPPNDNPDQMIYIHYGTGAPKTETITRRVPLFGVTGSNPVATYGSSRSSGTLTPNGNGYSYNGQSTSRTSTLYQNQYGITGVITKLETLTTYDQFLLVYSLDPDSTDEPKFFWHSFASTSDRSGDLRSAFPYLVAASTRYFGRSSGKRVEARLTGSDRIVTEIRNRPPTHSSSTTASP